MSRSTGPPAAEGRVGRLYRWATGGRGLFGRFLALTPDDKEERIRQINTQEDALVEENTGRPASPGGRAATTISNGGSTGPRIRETSA